MGKMRNAYILVGKYEVKIHSKDVGVDGTIILKGLFGKQSWRVWTGFMWLRIGTGGGLL
jgi:hypothetical protein